MRPLAVALLLLPLAGCVAQPPEPDGGGGAGPDAGVLPWGLTACRYLVGYAPADEARLREHLPEGFVPATFGSRALAGTPAGRALFGLEAFECASGEGLNGAIEGMVYGSYWTTVTPPEELRMEGVDTYTVRWDTLIPDADRRAVMLAAGMPARDGTVSFASDLPVGAGASYDMEGIGVSTMSMTASRTQGAPDGVGVVVEFTPTEDGRLAVWRADYAWDGDAFSTGYGSVTVPDGSWAAAVLGGTRAPAQFHAGTWTFSNGTLTLPRT